MVVVVLAVIIISNPTAAEVVLSCIEVEVGVLTILTMISILAPSPLYVDIPHLLITLVSSNYKTSLPSYNYYNLPSIVQHILLGVIHHPLG